MTVTPRGRIARAGNADVVVGNAIFDLGNALVILGDEFGVLGNESDELGNALGVLRNERVMSGNDTVRLGNRVPLAGNDHGNFGNLITVAGNEHIQLGNAHLCGLSGITTLSDAVDRQVRAQILEFGHREKGGSFVCGALGRWHERKEGKHTIVISYEDGWITYREDQS